MKYFIKSIIILNFILLGCNGKSQTLNCKERANTAAHLVNKYYQTKDSNDLKSAIPYLDSSMKCDNSKIYSVSLKFAILSLLKRYEEASLFSDSLKESDFDKPYKKVMSSLYFKGRIQETLGNLNKRNELFDSAVRYMEKNINPDKFDMKTYADIYFLKSFYLKPQEFSNELDSMKNKYPENKNFFEGLKNTYGDMNHDY